MVGEHSIALGRYIARYIGVIRRANVGISNDKASGNLVRRKVKGSYSMFDKIGLVGC